MQFSQQQMQYDRAKTIFSPDGRIFQVEYAREAVNRGTISVGIVFKNGVIIAAIKKKLKLQTEYPEKVFKVEDYVGVAVSGLVADGRNLVDDARMEAQRYMLVYDEPIPLYVLTKFIADKKQVYTQYGGVRPFGTAMIIGGMDETKPKVFQTDPSGIMKEFFAIAIGRGSEDVNNYFEKKFEPDMDRKAAIELTLAALKKGETEVTLKQVEMAIITDEKGMERLSPDDLKREKFKL